jgi:hypothetical protein
MTHFETLLDDKKGQVKGQVYWYQFDDREPLGGVIFRQISECVWSEIDEIIDTLYDEICRDIVDNYTV